MSEGVDGVKVKGRALAETHHPGSAVAPADSLALMLL